MGSVKVMFTAWRPTPEQDRPRWCRCVQVHPLASVELLLAVPVWYTVPGRKWGKSAGDRVQELALTLLEFL